MTKRNTRRYIERKLSVSKLIKMVPQELLENLAEDTNVDYQVKHLHGALMFKLFLFSILKSERLSTRLMELFYNSSEFSVFSGKGGHKTRHSSIADRIKSIDSKYFAEIFEAIRSILEKQTRKNGMKIMDTPLARMFEAASADLQSVLFFFVVSERQLRSKIK